MFSLLETVAGSTHNEIGLLVFGLVGFQIEKILQVGFFLQELRRNQCDCPEEMGENKGHLLNSGFRSLFLKPSAGFFALFSLPRQFFLGLAFCYLDISGCVKFDFQHDRTWSYRDCKGKLNDYARRCDVCGVVQPLEGFSIVW